jgi:hypothetical protein
MRCPPNAWRGYIAGPELTLRVNVEHEAVLDRHNAQRTGGPVAARTTEDRPAEP